MDTPSSILAADDDNPRTRRPEDDGAPAHLQATSTDEIAKAKAFDKKIADQQAAAQKKADDDLKRIDTTPKPLILDVRPDGTLVETGHPDELTEKHVQ